MSCTARTLVRTNLLQISMYIILYLDIAYFPNHLQKYFYTRLYHDEFQIHTIEFLIIVLRIYSKHICLVSIN